MALEWERLWTKAWLLAGRASAIPEPGDYFVFDIGRESILVVRQESGRISAFYNVCQHRGSPLCESGTGRVRAFECRYHRWRYGLDGSLLRISDEERFPGGVSKDDLCIPKVRCETWAGFVWVNMSKDGAGLMEFLGPLAAKLQPYGLEQYAMIRDETVEVDCNWKVGADNVLEWYHIQGIHPEILPVLDDTKGRLDLFGPHSRLVLPFMVPSSRLGPRPVDLDMVGGFLLEAGLDPSILRGGGGEPRLLVQRAVRQWRLQNSIDSSGLLDDQLSDMYAFNVFPNIQLNLHTNLLQLFRQRPHPADPGAMLLDQQEYRLMPAGAGPPARQTNRRFRHDQGSTGRVSDADIAQMNKVQRGLHSKGFQELKLSSCEGAVENLHKNIDALIFGPEGEQLL